MSVQKGITVRAKPEPTAPASEGVIQAQIDRLVGAKDSLKTSIANKGVTVPDSVKMDGLSTYVDSIEQLDTSDATAAAKDIMKDKTAYVDGVKVTGTREIKLQTKTIDPATYAKNAYPDDGYDGLSKVTVSAMPVVLQGTPVITVSEDGLITAKATQNPGYVNSGSKSSTQQLDTQAAKTVTPTTASQTAVAKGVYTTGAVTVAAVPTETKTVDLNISSGDQTVTSTSGKFMTSVTVNKPDTLIPGNIKSGVTIGGVTGTYEGSGYKIDATDNTDGTQNLVITDANVDEPLFHTTITPTVSDQVINIPITTDPCILEGILIALSPEDNFAGSEWTGAIVSLSVHLGRDTESSSSSVGHQNLFIYKNGNSKINDYTSGAKYYTTAPNGDSIYNSYSVWHGNGRSGSGAFIKLYTTDGTTAKKFGFVVGKTYNVWAIKRS